MAHIESCYALFFIFFFFKDTATTEIYTLSLHDALPICTLSDIFALGLVLYEIFTGKRAFAEKKAGARDDYDQDRKSTRLNSSHSSISYAVFCLKKKKQQPYYVKLLHSSHPTQYTYRAHS